MPTKKKASQACPAKPPEKQHDPRYMETWLYIGL